MNYKISLIFIQLDERAVKKDYHQSMKKISCMMLLFSLFSSLFAYGEKESASYQSTYSAKEEKNISEILYSVSNLYSFLDKNFLYEIDNDEVSDALISALVNSLGDEYSYFVKSDEADDFEQDLNGEYSGIGTYVSKMNPAFIDASNPETYMLKIVSPFPGGPADRAGLMSGDMIFSINGEDITAMDADEAAKMLRGKKGEEMVLGVYRNGLEFNLTVVPEDVVTPNSASTVLFDDVGYLAISTFNEMTAESVKEHLKNLEKAGISALIIDLRNNSGGIVDAALEISDFFLSEGTMVSLRYKDSSGNPDIRYTANKETLVSSSTPVVILVNGGTASASEIMTASLADNGRATVIGSNTFGKGIMQTVIPYSGGFVRFTSADYYTPNDVSINKTGIRPDIEIPEKTLSEEETKIYVDIINNGEIDEFIKEHPAYSLENVELFVSGYSEEIDKTFLSQLIQSEYIYRMPSHERPVVSYEYDDVLKAALSFLGKDI